jgi:hypothetical protein
MDDIKHKSPYQEIQSGKREKAKAPEKPPITPIQKIKLAIGWHRLTLSEIPSLEYLVTGRTKRRA